MQKRWKIIKHQKLLLLCIIISFQPIFRPWSRNSYRWVSRRLWSYYVKICYVKNKLNAIGNNAFQSNNNNGIDAVLLLRTGESLDINPIQERGEGSDETLAASFSSVTSTNVGLSPQNFLTFSLTFLPYWCKISRPYLVQFLNFWN